MANPSIYAVFEQLWKNVLIKLNNYVSTDVLDGHIENNDNPHSVNKEQVGLENVDNTSDLDKPISNDMQTALDNKTDLGIFNNHTSNMGNPHVVTAEQVGALPITGGAMENAVTLKGIALTEGIDYGAGDPSGGVLGQLYFKKVT